MSLGASIAGQDCNTALSAICVPLNAWWTGSELAYGLENFGASIVVRDVARWEALRPEIEAFHDLRESGSSTVATNRSTLLMRVKLASGVLFMHG